MGSIIGRDPEDVGNVREVENVERLLSSECALDARIEEAAIAA